MVAYSIEFCLDCFEAVKAKNILNFTQQATLCL